MMKANDFLKEFLVDSDLFTSEEFSNLTESTRTESIREVTITVLNSIREKMESFNTTPIDRSRGDIKQMKELVFLQQAITQLETLIERSQEVFSPQIEKYLKETIKAILYLNQYSAQFKEAYLNRQTLLILKYQSMIMSIFSSASYLISIMIDFSTGDIQLKNKPSFEEIAPLKTIIEFNKMVEKGDFRLVLKNVNTIREYFIELDLTDSSLVLESYEIIDLVINGIKGIVATGDRVNSDKFVEFFYKAAGVLTLIFSMREIFYTMFRAKTKFQEILGNIEGFANAPNAGMGLLNKLNNFVTKFVVDVEESSKIAKREIESEDSNIANTIRMIPKKPLQLQTSSENAMDSFNLNF